MSINNRIKEKLILYIHNLLDEQEKEEIEFLLKNSDEYQDEYTKLKKIKRSMDHPSQIEPTDRMELVLKKIKAQNNQKERESILYKIPAFFNFHKRLVYGIGLVFGALCVVLILSYLYNTQFEQDYLYILRASGKVRINGQLFNHMNDYKIKLDQKIHIDIDQGKCTLQLNQNKLIQLKEKTEVFLVSKRNINIKFNEGHLIGHVIKDSSAKFLNIITDKINFKIIGTVFSIKKRNSCIECFVRTGKVRAEVNNKKVYIKKRDKLKMKKNEYKVKTYDPSEEKIFYDIDKVKIKDDFKNIKRVFIKELTPSVKEAHKDIKYLPAFLLIQNDNKKFIPVQVESDSIRDDKLIDLSIKTNLFSKHWFHRFHNNIYINPYYIKGYLIILDGKGKISKFDINKKKVIWQFNTKGRLVSEPLFSKGILYVPSSNDYLYALNFKTGLMKWKKRIGFIVYSAPQYYNGKIYLCDSYGYIRCLKSSTGKLLWKRKFDKGFFSVSLMNEHYLFIGGLSGRFYCIDLEKKSIKWQFQAKARILTKPLIKDKLIFFGSNDKNIYALDVETGILRWKKMLDSPIFSSPLLLNGHIVITSLSGHVYFFNRYNGKMIWEFTLPGTITMNPYLLNRDYICINADNKIYILNSQGQLVYMFPFQIRGFAIGKGDKLFLYTYNNYLYKYNLLP